MVSTPNGPNQAQVAGLRDGWNYHIRNGKKAIALQSPNKWRKGPKPLFRGQSRNLRAAGHFVRYAEV